MLNVLELEKKHLLLKKKKQTPKILFFILLLGVTFIISFIFYLFYFKMTPQNQAHKKSQQPQQKIAVVTTQKKEILKSSVAKKIVDKKIVTANSSEKAHYTPAQKLTPSMHFLQNIKKEVHHSKEKIRPIQKKEKVVPKKITQEKKHPQDITFTKQKDIQNLKEVIKRFKKNKNPALGLFIARMYYKMGKYYYAYNYAITTNELNANIEEIWLIYAKSLVKLKQKKRAINALKQYIQTTKSKKASILLDAIKNGTFR